MFKLNKVFIIILAILFIQGMVYKGQSLCFHDLGCESEKNLCESNNCHKNQIINKCHDFHTESNCTDLQPKLTCDDPILDLEVPVLVKKAISHEKQKLRKVFPYIVQMVKHIFSYDIDKILINDSESIITSNTLTLRSTVLLI